MRVASNASGRAGLGPIHWPYVELGGGPETLQPALREVQPALYRDQRLQEKCFGRFVDSGKVPIQIRRHSLERASPVKHHRAKPARMGARTHDADVTGMPIPFKKGPGAGEARGPKIQFDGWPGHLSPPPP